MGSFSDTWSKAGEEGQYKIRVAGSLRHKIKSCNSMYWRENNEWIVKDASGARIPQPSWCAAVSLCLEIEYGIKIKILTEKPLTYELLPDSQPILNEERFAAAIDPKEMEHIKALSPIDWQVIYQVLSKAAYDKDPLRQIPAAKLVLKKLQGSLPEGSI